MNEEKCLDFYYYFYFVVCALRSLIFVAHYKFTQLDVERHEKRETLKMLRGATSKQIRSQFSLSRCGYGI